MQRKTGKIIIPLDVPGEERALELVDLLLPLTPFFKVGLELFNHVGPAIVKKIRDRGGHVFLDLKYHDIPNTVAGAVRAAVSTGAFMFNLHAVGGEEMLLAAVEAASEESEKLGLERPLILGVTVLTSFTPVSLKQVGVERPLEGQVLELARLCRRCGLQGVVASPLETARLRRELGDDFVIVTPGVRLPGAALQDQKRVMAPREAVEAGADYVVIGRPVTGASDPRKALADIIEAMNH
jgi:orotidine-5'-phosphate decarboxylase